MNNSEQNVDLLPSASIAQSNMLAVVNLRNMNLTLLLDYVLPSGSVLMKHCNGAWEFYKSDDDFIKGESQMSQDCNEDVHHFLERLVQQLMKEEENDEERLVAIDYAIWSNHKERSA